MFGRYGSGSQYRESMEFTTDSNLNDISWVPSVMPPFIRFFNFHNNLSVKKLMPHGRAYGQCRGDLRPYSGFITKYSERQKGILGRTGILESSFCLCSTDGAQDNTQISTTSNGMKTTSQNNAGQCLEQVCLPPFQPRHGPWDKLLSLSGLQFLHRWNGSVISTLKAKINFVKFT